MNWANAFNFFAAGTLLNVYLVNVSIGTLDKTVECAKIELKRDVEYMQRDVKRDIEYLQRDVDRALRKSSSM